MLHEERGAEENLLYKQHAKDSATQNHAKQTGWTEKVKWPRHVAEKESNREQIEENSQRPRNTIVGLPAGTNDILDRYFDNFGAVQSGKCRNKTVHFTVQADVLNDFTAINLERGSEIVNIDSRQLGHHPVCNS